jgi:DNA-binding response OmpR family regulator
MQFVEAINSIASGPRKPIIMVTALRKNELHQALISAGASACLTKPVNAQELSKTARQLLLINKQIYRTGLIA